jgi:hypothetical protein
MLKRTIFLAAVRATLALLVGTAIAPGSLTGPVTLAQSTTSARLTGSVTDQTGAVVPDALVVALNIDTSLSLTATSDSAGTYAFNSIPAGNYKVTATAAGFETLVETGVNLTVGQSATLNLPLKTGGASDTVTVEGGAELINTTSADLGQVVDETTIQELPLNGRDPGTLVTLSAGVTNELNSNASTLQTTNSFPNETGASAGGQRQGSTWYLLDGVSHMDTYLLLALPFPNPEATQEFRVITNNFDARNGFAPAAIVSIQTKSGSNKFHGGVFDFLRNGSFNAADYFSGHNGSPKQVNPLHRNQFGAYIGGYVPHFKDKLFFFSNYQGTRATSQSTTNTTFTPTQAERSGDFTALLNNVGPDGLPDPIMLPAPFVNNKIDPTLYSAGSVKLLANIPVGSDPLSGEVNVAYPKQPTVFNENTPDHQLRRPLQQLLQPKNQEDLQRSLRGLPAGRYPGHHPGRWRAEHDLAVDAWFLRAGPVQAASEPDGDARPALGPEHARPCGWRTRRGLRPRTAEHALPQRSAGPRLPGRRGHQRSALQDQLRLL